MKKTVFFAGAVALFFSCNSTKKETASDLPKAFDVSYIDSTVNPCDNFYSYAIGNWQKLNPVPETESRWMAFNILYEQNRQKLLKIIDEVVANKSAKKGSDAQMIRDFYLSGMDSVGLEKKGLTDIQDILTEIKQAERKEDIIHLFGELAPIGVSTPIGFYIGADDKNSKMNAVYASQSGLSLPDRDYYLSKDAKFVDIRTAYVKHINNMYKLAGNEETVGDAVLALETKLAEASWTRTERRDPNKSYNKKALLDWDNSLANLDMANIFKTRGFGKFDTLIVSQPSFYTALDKIVGEVSVDDWKAYLTWKTLNSFSSFTTAAMEKESFDFYSTTLRGTKEMKPRNERVFNTVNGSLGEPLGKLFVERYFSEESKQYLATMIENLRSAYKESITNLTWMSNETKEKAMKKLDAFTYKVGYPDKWEDYSKMEITPDSYVKNVIAARKFGYEDMLDKLGKPVDKTEWGMTPQTVNAYYNSSNNEIVFPAGILQPPFFHKSFDDAINYGGIGAVIGHEFSHGFDDQGSKFDWDGNLNDWWTAEDRAKFDALASKLGSQYNAYSPVNGMHVDGAMTMGENIADLGGVTLAYAALQKKYAGKMPEPIDGYTWQQRFFLGWANVWKGNIKEEELINRLKSDVHSPAEYRVIGPLVNFSPYYEAFGACDSGMMYKPDSARIRIW